MILCNSTTFPLGLHCFILRNLYILGNILRAKKLPYPANLPYLHFLNIHTGLKNIYLGRMNAWNAHMAVSTNHANVYMAVANTASSEAKIARSLRAPLHLQIVGSKKNCNLHRDRDINHVVAKMKLCISHANKASSFHSPRRCSLLNRHTDNCLWHPLSYL